MTLIATPSTRLIGVVIACILLLAAVPAFVAGFWLRILTDVLMYVIMTQGLNIIAGYVGLAALGNFVFFGAGAYAVAIAITRFNFDFLPALLCAGVFAALFGAVAGIPLLRLKGHYFVMGTIGFAFFIRQVVLNLDVAGGARGIALPVPSLGPAQLYALVYYVMLVIACLSVASVWVLSGSRYGLALRAIRADEDAARVMGIRALNYKIAAWSLSGLFTGLAGGVYAYWSTFIEPAVVFDLTMSIKFFVMLLLGGAGTVMGPVVGAVIIELLSDFAWGNFPEYHLIVLGVLVVLVTLLLPTGVMALLNRRTRGFDVTGIPGALRRFARGRV